MIKTNGYIILVTRASVSAVLVTSSVGKIFWATDAITTSFSAVSFCDVSVIFLSFVIALEIYLSIAVWLKGYYRSAFLMTGGLMLMFIVFHLLRNTSSSCGCFGALELSRGWMVAICSLVLLLSGVGYSLSRSGKQVG